MANGRKRPGLDVRVRHEVTDWRPNAYVLRVFALRPIGNYRCGIGKFNETNASHRSAPHS